MSESYRDHVVEDTPLARAMDRLALAVVRLDTAVPPEDDPIRSISRAERAPPVGRDDVARRLDAAVDRLKALLGE